MDARPDPGVRLIDDAPLAVVINRFISIEGLVVEWSVWANRPEAAGLPAGGDKLP